MENVEQFNQGKDVINDKEIEKLFSSCKKIFYWEIVVFIILFIFILSFFSMSNFFISLNLLGVAFLLSFFLPFATILFLPLIIILILLSIFGIIKSRKLKKISLDGQKLASKLFIVSCVFLCFPVGIYVFQIIIAILAQ